MPFIRYVETKTKRNHPILSREKVEADIPPEILNNVGSLHYRQSETAKALECFEGALVKCQRDSDDDPYYNQISVTIRYNLGRVYERLCQHDKAERLYKDIVVECPNYIDCQLRLGCMLRDQGQIYEASEKFKDALQFSREHPDAWSLIGES